MWEKRVEPNSGTAHVAKCFPTEANCWHVFMYKIENLPLILKNPMENMLHATSYYKFTISTAL